MPSERLVGGIKEGIVVDHIPRGVVWRVANILRVYGLNGRISLADGCESTKMPEGKGVLKIEGRYPSDNELNLIGVVAPSASVSVIRDSKVVSKRKVEVPSILEGLVKCPNGNCISNDTNEGVASKIHYDREQDAFSCHYCRYYFTRGEINL